MICGQVRYEKSLHHEEIGCYYEGKPAGYLEREPQRVGFQWWIHGIVTVHLADKKLCLSSPEGYSIFQSVGFTLIKFPITTM